MIEISGLTKKLGKSLVLDNVTFLVEKGDIFGYLGPNGAGKTTTIRIILGLLNPDKGKILIFDKNVIKYGVQIRRRIGFILENDGLYNSLSVYDNLKYYAQIYGLNKNEYNRSIEYWLKYFGIYDHINNKVAVLSKGMRQKLAICRSLVHDPELFIFDEPMSSLDPETQQIFRKLLQDLLNNKDKTIFLSSHNLSEIDRLCSKIAIINYGKIEMCEKITDLKEIFSKPQIKISLESAREFANEIVDKIKELKDIKSCFQQNNNTLYASFKEKKNISPIIQICNSYNLKISEIKDYKVSIEDIYFSIIGN